MYISNMHGGMQHHPNEEAEKAAPLNSERGEVSTNPKEEERSPSLPPWVVPGAAVSSSLHLGGAAFLPPPIVVLRSPFHKETSLKQSNNQIQFYETI